MKNIIALISILLFMSCDKNTHSEDLLTYQDYKNDQKIGDSLNKTNDCEIKLKLIKGLRTIDFLKRKASVLDNCGGKIINSNIEKVNEDVVDKLSYIFQADQKAREQIYDSLGNDFSFQELAYYVSSYGYKIDALSYERFDKLVDSIGEWPGINYVPREPYYPKTEVLVTHFPEEGFVEYVKMAIEAAHHGKEYWSKAKQMVEYSIVKPHIQLWHEQEGRNVFPFRFIEFKKNGAIDEESELTVLDLENIHNRQYNQDRCFESKFTFSSSLPEQKDREKLLEQLKSYLIRKGYSEELIELDFEKQEPYHDYKLFFEEECV